MRCHIETEVKELWVIVIGYVNKEAILKGGLPVSHVPADATWVRDELPS